MLAGVNTVSVPEIQVIYLSTPILTLKKKISSMALGDEVEEKKWHLTQDI